MAHMLGTIEVGHTKPSPIFPSTVLGHLFMRKYGLSREQRAQVIRSTGGSSKFHEVERILRASDFDESRSRADERRHVNVSHPARTPRRDAMMLQQEAHAVDDESSELMEPMTSGSESAGALAVDHPDDMHQDMMIQLTANCRKSMRSRRRPKGTLRNPSKLTRRADER